MASRAVASVALLLTLNILFFTLVSSCAPPPGKSPSLPKPKPKTYLPPPPPKPRTSSPPPPPSTPAAVTFPEGTCPYDSLKLQACANVLNLVNVFVGEQDRKTCCSLINGLVDLEAAVCLCTRIRLNLLGLIKLDIPLAVQALINECNVNVAKEFTCPSN